MKKNRIIFRVVFILFILIALALVWNMAENTTSPWEKTKKIENKK